MQVPSDTDPDYGPPNRRAFEMLHPLSDGTEGGKDDWVFMYDPATRQLTFQRRGDLRKGRQYNIGRIGKSDVYIHIWKGDGKGPFELIVLEEQDESTDLGLNNDVFVALVEGKGMPPQLQRFYMKSWSWGEESSGVAYNLKNLCARVKDKVLNSG